MTQNINEMLKDIGFTQNESRVYIKLLEVGESKTGVLCKQLNIPSSNIYSILESLINKGVVSCKFFNNVKIFMPNNPESLNLLFIKRKELLEKQRTQTQQVIAQLKKIPTQIDTYSDYKYYEGILGIKSMWMEIREMMPKNKEYAVFGSVEESFATLNAFYMETHSIRKKKKIKERIILPEGSEKYGIQREKIGLCEIKYMELQNEAEFGAFDKFMYIQSNNKKHPRSFLIKDETFAKTFRDIFEKLWKQAKK